jgi:hypothetical protein
MTKSLPMKMTWEIIIENLLELNKKHSGIANDK